MRVATLMVLAGVCGAAAFGAGLPGCSNDAAAPAPLVDGGVTPVDGAVTPTPLPPLENSPPPRTPINAVRDASSSPVAFDAFRGGVWTANGDGGSVSYVDVDGRKVVQEIAVGKDIRGIALSPDSRWIAAVDRDGASVTLIDAEARVARRTIAIGTHPRAAIWDAYDPRWLYVALEDDSAIAIIDRTNGILSRTVSVGRLPSGLAVSRQRRELYVTHRIDGRVTILPLDGAYAPADQNQPLVEVTLEDEADTGDPKVPHGKPFAFEGLAWAPDGNVAWMPHELFAPTHPFQFQSTLFPAISVVDLSARAEVETDPADPNGAIAGRKNLFAAINLIDPTGNPMVVSQPCAAAIHPNGVIGYALACASEDLLVFDLLAGVAVDIVRNLPGDHPSGLTLDDTGQRAFVLSDQSHTLLTLDTAGGSPIKHIKVTGDPIALVAKDPVDAEVREGLKIFFRANSSKGDLATTGNDWMSCAGCHLDGFVSTNLAFFEDAKIVDPTIDANVGHEGLTDLFSSSPTPGDAKFKPHDVLVAFTEQGGIAPDRTGQLRDGAIDPAAPTAAATTMAARVSRVIARDLPIGPSWLLMGDEKPNADDDGVWCGQCHQAELTAWQKSVHAHASEDPMVRFGAGVEEKLRGPQYARLCSGCHDPVSARLGDTSLTSARGITCLGCHDTERLLRAGGNADLEARTHDWNVDHAARAKAGLTKLRDPEFCGGCHQQFVPGQGLTAISTLHEYQGSSYAPVAASGGDGGSAGGANGDATKACVDCHAQKTNGVADHTMIGGNVYMAAAFGDAAFIEAETENLRAAIGIVATRSAGNVKITLKNRGAGHSFPTGVTDIREPWVELQVVDASKKVVARYGGPDASGVIPATAARLGMDIAKPDGTLLYLHELSEATRIPFDTRVPAGGTVDFTIAAPALPAGAVELDAVLFYRNVRTPYYRAAVGKSQGSAPEVEVARVVVP